MIKRRQPWVMHLSKPLSSQSGQGMSETAIIVALVSVVGISGLSLLSDGLQQALNGQGGGLQSQELSVLSTKKAVAPPVKADLSSGIPLSATGDEAVLRLNLSNGQYIDLKNYPADLTQQIETTGANATTQMLLGTMESMIQNSLANGTITENDANELMALSRQGHVIADLQGQLENAMSAGNQDLMRELSNQIGYHAIGNGQSYEDKEVAQFRSLLTGVQGKGVLQDPVLNQSVSILVNQIINISGGLDEAAYFQPAGGYKSPKEMTQVVVNGMHERDNELKINTQRTLLDLGASAVSHQNATEICQAGAGPSGAGCN